jgi:hypothetical protein
MKLIHDLLTAIAHGPIDVRKLLEWASNSLDPHEVTVWWQANARWFACRARAALAGARAALFPPRGRPPTRPPRSAATGTVGRTRPSTTDQRPIFGERL